MGIQINGTPMKPRPKLNADSHQQFTKQSQFDEDTANKDEDSGDEEEDEEILEDEPSCIKTARTVSKEENNPSEKIEPNELEHIVGQLNLASEPVTQVL